VEGELEKAVFLQGSYWGLIKGHNVWTKEQTLGGLLLKLKGDWVRAVLGPKSDSKKDTYQLFGIEKIQAPTNVAPPATPERKARRTK
jgi:hypothetical protein